MGTHPIFESDFDCLTEMSNVLDDQVALDQVNETKGALQELVGDKVKDSKNYILHKGEDFGIITSAAKGWNPLDQAKNQMQSLTEVSAGTVGLLTWTSAFNTIFNSFLLNRLNDLNRKTSFANKLQQLQKWRADDELIRRHIDQGYKLVMRPNQQFYIGHFYPGSIISLGQLTHEKIFICAGKYRIK